MLEVKNMNRNKESISRAYKQTGHGLRKNQGA